MVHQRCGKKNKRKEKGKKRVEEISQDEREKIREEEKEYKGLMETFLHYIKIQNKIIEGFVIIEAGPFYITHMSVLVEKELL